MVDQFDRAGDVPNDTLRLAEAYVFASPEPVTARALAQSLPEARTPTL